MIVSMWMTRDLVTIGPDTPIVDVAALMARKRIRRLPVVEKHGDSLRLVCIVSAKDVLHAFPSNVNPFAVDVSALPQTSFNAEKIMSREPLAANDDAGHTD